MMEEVVEKRRAFRTKEESLVRFEGEDFSIYSRVTNRSPIGAFVATHYLLDPGTRISLFLVDSDGKESNTLAQVVRFATESDEKGEPIVGLGVEFLKQN